MFARSDHGIYSHAARVPGLRGRPSVPRTPRLPSSHRRTVSLQRLRATNSCTYFALAGSAIVYEYIVALTRAGGWGMLSAPGRAPANRPVDSCGKCGLVTVRSLLQRGGDFGDGDCTFAEDFPVLIL
jgi:hypothetical protein